MSDECLNGCRLTDSEGESEDRDEDQWRKKSDDVASQHGIIGTGTRNRKTTALLFGSHEPSDQRAGESKRWRKCSCVPIETIPHQSQGGWDHSTGNNNAHHKVDITERDTSVVKTSGERSHEETESDDHRVGSIDQTTTRGIGLDVRLVDIVSEDGGHGNELGGHGGGHRHEDNEEGGNCSSLAEECDGSVRQDESG